MANPHSPDTPHWEAAFEHYYQDRLPEAYSEIQNHGVGEAGELLRWYRIIEAEALTRRGSKVQHIAPWLSLEFIPEETLGLESKLAVLMLEACEAVAERLGWTHSVMTRLAILAEETDAPWASNPYGYCVSKEPFEKICLPNYLVDDPSEFSQAVAHEYAHVISTDIADDYAPSWVEEAISVLVERRFAVDIWERFCHKGDLWLNAARLESVLVDRSDDDGAKEEIFMAYQQAGWIGRFLATRYGDQRLGEFLREIANESPGRNVTRSLMGRDRTEDALRRVFGLKKKDLFSETLRWMKTLNRHEL